MRRPADKQQSELILDHFESRAVRWQSLYAGRDLNARNIQLRQTHVLKYVDSLGLKKGARVLDLGCGAGLTVVELLKRGYDVAACDVSASMLDLARENCATAGYTSNVTFELQSAEDLKLESEWFDLVIAMGLIEYLEWDRWALQLMHGVLRPGGHLIVTAPNKIRLSYLADPSWQIRQMRRLIGRGRSNHGQAVKDEPAERESSGPRDRSEAAAPAAFARNQYVPRNLDRTLDQLGFTVRASNSHGFGPFRLLGRSNTITLALHRIIQTCNGVGVVPWLRRFGNNYNVLCQKVETKRESRMRRLQVDTSTNWKPFKSTYSAAFQRLDEWVEKHPEYGTMPVLRIETDLNDGSDLLVLSPHPDDEIIGCGGTLTKLIGRGARVTVAHLTDGGATIGLRGQSDDIRGAVRLEEAQRVAKRLGVADLVLLKEPDANLVCDDRTVRPIVQLLERLRPAAIFTPFINDPHPDHLATSRILQRALAESSLDLDSTKVLGYEVWSFVPPNALCVIDDQFDDKEDLLLAYRTGMKVVNYVAFCEALNSFRAHTGLGHSGYAEAFFSLGARRYLEL